MNVKFTEFTESMPGRISDNLLKIAIRYIELKNKYRCSMDDCDVVDIICYVPKHLTYYEQQDFDLEGCYHFLLNFYCRGGEEADDKKFPRKERREIYKEHHIEECKLDYHYVNSLF